MPDTVEVLIFDDDSVVGQMALDLVASIGYSCRLLPDGRTFLEQVREFKPRLVLLDIMMPGVDGLSLCQMLRAQTQNREPKVVIVSSKPGAVEQPRALKAGADAFVQKPYAVAEFLGLLRQLLGPAPFGAAPAAALQVQVWGCRGPSKEPIAKSSWGRLTSCVSIRSRSGEFWILDAGSGLAPCAESLLKSGAPKELTILLTHYHADHVQGLAGLSLAGQEGLTLKIGGPRDPEVQLPDLLYRHLGRPDLLKAKVGSFFLAEEGYQLSPATQLEVLHAHHPTTTLAFALRLEGRRVVYCPDSEVPDRAGPVFSDYEERVRRFSLGADLLIHNAQYSPEDYAGKRDQGASSWEGALRVAAEAGVRRLILFHLEASYTDERLGAEEARAAVKAREEAGSFDCRMARDGMTLEL